METRTCTKCKISKPIDLFPKDKFRKPDKSCKKGYFYKISRCKKCCYKSDNSRRKRDREGQNNYEKKCRELLTDRYIKILLIKSIRGVKLKKSEISQDLIALKRKELILKRKINDVINS